MRIPTRRMKDVQKPPEDLRDCEKLMWVLDEKRRALAEIYDFRMKKITDRVDRLKGLRVVV